MPPTAPRDLARRIRTPAYAFLVVTLMFQFTDFMIGVAPFRIESVIWRFSTIGGAANSVGNFLLLVLLIYAVGLTFADRRALWFAGAVSAFIALVLIVGTGSFTLDALQLRSQVDASGVKKFDSATAQALVKLVFEAVVATVFAFSAFRAALAAKKEAQLQGRGFDSPIVSRATPLRSP